MNLLAVDTSTPTGGVAVMRDGAVVVSMEVTQKKTHARRLMVAVDTAFQMAGMAVTDCHGFAVTVGPGSFTGLRIGMSTVKALAFSTGKPIAGVSTLDVLVRPLVPSSYPACPMLDARKEQVFTALYQWGPDGWKKTIDEVAVDPERWLEKINQPCLFVGDGAEAYRGCIEQQLGDRAVFAPAYFHTPRAAVLAEMGLEVFEQGRAVDAALLEARYLRKSDAEIHRQQSKALPKS